MRRVPIISVLCALALLCGERQAGASGLGEPAAAPSEVARLAANRAAFLEAALKKPVPGVCELLSSDPGFREEMLVRFGDRDAKTYERRVAFVVGNGAYRSPVVTLRNTPNDAASMATMFRALGFTVYRAVDAPEKTLDDCFARFKSDLEQSDARGEKADIALFFYAGHGLQLTSTEDNEKRNYMLSVDARVDPATGKARGFRQVDKVLTEMRAHARQAVFLYDACRNAPYEEGTVKEADGQPVRATDASVGAAPVDAEESERASQAGLFIAYATSPGKTANDAWGPTGSTHSPFTEALLKNLPTPGAILEEALARSYYAVNTLTGGKQTPWTSSSLQEPIQMNGGIGRGDLRSKSDSFAADAAEFNARALRGEAIAAALKGQPATWIYGPSAAPFAPARAALSRAFASTDVAFMGHRGPVRAVSFSENGSRLATASSDGSAMLWDSRTGALIRLFTMMNQVAVTDVSISRAGDRLLTASKDGTAAIWDIETLARPLRLSDVGEIDEARFNPSNDRILTRSGSTATLWSATDGSIKWRFEGDGAPIIGMAFTPAGVRLVTAKEETAKIWDAAAKRMLAVLDGHKSYIGTAEFSPNGEYVATGSHDRTARIWNAKSGAFVRELAGYDGRITDIAFSPDGRHAAVASQGTLIVWNIPDGAALKKKVFGELIWRVAVSPGGKTVAVGLSDGSARIVDAGGGALLRTLSGHTSLVRRAAFSPDGGRILTDALDAVTKVWDARDGRELVSVAGEDGYDGGSGWSPDGRSFVTPNKDVAHIRRASDGGIIRTLTGHERTVKSARFSPDGRRVITAARDGTARLWDASSGAEVRRFDLEFSDALDAQFSPDGRSVLLIPGSIRATLAEADSGKVTGRFGGFFVVGAGGLRPDGKKIVLAGSTDALARTWDVATSDQELRLVGHTSILWDAAYSPDGLRILTAASDGTARLWDADTGSQLTAFEDAGDIVASAAFSPDGRQFVTGSFDQTAKIWDAGLYGPELLAAAYDLLTDQQIAKVERGRIRYWEVDRELLQ